MRDVKVGGLALSRRVFAPDLSERGTARDRGASHQVRGRYFHSVMATPGCIALVSGA